MLYRLKPGYILQAPNMPQTALRVNNTHISPESSLNGKKVMSERHRPANDISVWRLRRLNPPPPHHIPLFKDRRDSAK